MANSAHFFPAGSRLDVERPSSLRRTPTRSVVRSESSDDTTTSDGRSSRPSNINWLQNPLAASQAGAPMPKRPPSARLGRSASLSAIPGPSPLRRQSSLISNHSLQLDRLVGSHTDGPSALSPISEQSYVPTPTSRRDLFPTDAEPSTPVSVGKLHQVACKNPGCVIHCAFSRSFYLLRLLTTSLEAIDLSNVDQLTCNIHLPPYPPALEHHASRHPPRLPSSLAPCGPTALLDRIRRHWLRAHGQLCHRTFGNWRRRQRDSRRRKRSGRPRSLRFYHALLPRSPPQRCNGPIHRL